MTDEDSRDEFLEDVEKVTIQEYYSFQEPDEELPDRTVPYHQFTGGQYLPRDPFSETATLSYSACNSSRTTTLTSGVPLQVPSESIGHILLGEVTGQVAHSHPDQGYNNQVNLLPRVESLKFVEGIFTGSHVSANKVLSKKPLPLGITNYLSRILEELNENIDSSFPCMFCTLTFTQHNTLKTHYQRSHGIELSYTCPVCGIGFMNNTAMQKHKYSHIAGNKRCGVAAPIRSQESRCHSNQAGKHTNVGGPRFTCQICFNYFTSKESLALHVRAHDKAMATRLSCEPSGKSFALPEHLTARKRTHVAGKCLFCVVCGKRYASEATLKIHTEGHSQQTERRQQFACIFCKDCYGTKTKLLSHTCFFASSSYECTICKSRFSSDKKLKVHLQEHASTDTETPEVFSETIYATLNTTLLSKGEPNVQQPFEKKRFVCKYCDMRFHKQATLFAHTILGRKVRPQPYRCDACNEVFSTLSLLSDHRFESDIAYDCVACAKSYPSQCSFKQHTRAVHVEKPYQCLGCGLCYLSPSCGIIHARTCGRKPFKCMVCDDDCCWLPATHLRAHAATHAETCPDWCEDFWKKVRY